MIDLRPIGEATIMSEESKFAKYDIIFFLGRIFIPTLKKSFY